MRITGTGVGAIVSLLTMLLFSGFREIENRKRTGAGYSAGEILNDIGFGMFPGIAVWKVFEQKTVFGTGTASFEPIGRLPFLTESGTFMVSRTEMILAAVCFAGIIFWLMLRKDDIPGNGDLFLSVLCIWGLARAFTEGLRETTLLRAGSVNLTQIFLLASADISLAVWTIRREAAQKNTAFSILEWIAVLSSEAVMVLNTADILSAGSGIGDLAVNAGCTVLCLLLILPAGKDSRS